MSFPQTLRELHLFGLGVILCVLGIFSFSYAAAFLLLKK